MSSQEPPLPPIVVKQLNDRVYERRKAGALEIEKIIVDLIAKENYQGALQIIVYLGREFANAPTPQPRNGGLIGLAACAIALGTKDAPRFVADLVKPALGCFTDSDQRIRYYACEALYNICKVTRGAILAYFNDIFDGLSKLADDQDSNVRSGSELLDRLIKDIVSESAGFNIPAFIPLLRERIYTKKPNCRRFIVSWITLLNTVPDINMLVYLPEFLDGLFLVLGEPSPEVRHMFSKFPNLDNSLSMQLKRCQEVINQFSIMIKTAAIKEEQGLTEDDFKVDYPSMTNILITHCQSKDTTIQLCAVEWLKSFLELAGRQMLPFCPGIVDCIVPTQSYQDDRKACRECAKHVNTQLKSLIKAEDDEPRSTLLDTSGLVKILVSLVHKDSMHTKIACLKWFLHLFKTIPVKIFSHVDDVFPLLLRTLTHESDEVVIADLDVLAEVAATEVPAGKDLIGAALPEDVKKTLLQSVSQYFVYTMQSLLRCFATDRALLDEKGFFIIRQLCLLLNAESVYRTLSELLCICEDLQFASVMITNLNSILLTATELFPLRNTLKTVDSECGMSLFRCLYMSWCHNPVAAVALCLLTQQYRLSSDILHQFGNIDVSVELLTEVDKLVQLLESPIFIYLRLQLLEPESNHYIVKTLYSILMLLPQSEAFKILQNRLQCVSQLHPQKIMSQTASYESADLLEQFKTVQERHTKYKRSQIISRSMTHR